MRLVPSATAVLVRDAIYDHGGASWGKRRCRDGRANDGARHHTRGHGTAHADVVVATSGIHVDVLVDVDGGAIYVDVAIDVREIDVDIRRTGACVLVPAPF